MLSDDMKRQLFAWIRPHLNWLKVVMLGNRSSDLDFTLLKELRDTLGADSTVEVCHVSARLRIDKIFEVKAVRSDLLQPLTRWYKALRALLSDDVLTLRNVDDIHVAFEKRDELRLAGLLHDKLPTLARPPRYASLACDQR